MTDNILTAYGLDPAQCRVDAFGSGLINDTWNVTNGADAYILQSINTNIFKSPRAIADNLNLLDAYLKQQHPGYIFPAPLPTLSGEYLVVDDGKHYRLLPFVKNSHTIDVVTTADQAYEAAKQFGRFSKMLNGFDASQLQYTLPDFHNLDLRVQQFEQALGTADSNRLRSAEKEVAVARSYSSIADTYRDIVNNKTIPLRVIHHDTKISNVLFDNADKGICVIDLDTVMPGYFISDVGDMMRTYLSPANEEEQDLDKINIRVENIRAIADGYLSEMGDVLTPAERELFFYSGKFMIWMQALRFLTDHLNGDIYYHTKYPGHNLARAQNQLLLLERFVAMEKGL
ncbi:phosphotransferase enzyme family protein [Mucilaginibacter myungsuensis]|uniref:Phosphotransferase n=1 Tax=Mucilaginibacter myungsuensis TaxID=649104 RepID=A0A929KYV5_9SPHI|nr:phosphotransferase [Mucilaginibacter myungsuensis]MBE9664224.1 phosphotransferase [Mucilaginibacter myungsuensis]MDN3599928.1 phosphotransferase [Mucilaginibacter myungsuensis]